MNSESFRDIESAERPEVLKQAAKEEAVLIQGKLSQDFTEHAAWKLYEKELQVVEDGLTYKLLHSQGLSKGEMERIIDRLNLVETFRKLPIKFIERMRLLINRKIKGGN